MQTIRLQTPSDIMRLSLIAPVCNLLNDEASLASDSVEIEPSWRGSPQETNSGKMKKQRQHSEGEQHELW